MGLQAAAAGARAEAESRVATLQEEVTALRTSHAKELAAAKAAAQQLEASSSNELVQRMRAELASEKEAAIAEVCRLCSPLSGVSVVLRSGDAQRDAEHAARLDEERAVVRRLEEDLSQLRASMEDLAATHVRDTAALETALRTEGERKAEQQACGAGREGCFRPLMVYGASPGEGSAGSCREGEANEPGGAAEDSQGGGPAAAGSGARRSLRATRAEDGRRTPGHGNC